VVRLRGELDLGSEPKVAAELAQVVSSRPDELVLDLRELSFIDVRGTHALVEARRRCIEEGARLYLVPGPPNVHRVLSLCGVEREFETIDDPDQ
jgi:anti-sigma B factor antagonist